MKVTNVYKRVVRGVIYKKTGSTTAFSHFIREASSEDKKKLYTTVITKANEDQKAVIKAAEKMHGYGASCV